MSDNVWNGLVIAVYRSDTSNHKNTCSCKLPVLCKMECNNWLSRREIEHGEFSVIILMDIRTLIHVCCLWYACYQAKIFTAEQERQRLVTDLVAQLYNFCVIIHQDISQQLAVNMSQQIYVSAGIVCLLNF
jgi:molybdopterin-guanine dinucleotide biosynthesis protein A